MGSSDVDLSDFLPVFCAGGRDGLTTWFTTRVTTWP